MMMMRQLTTQPCVPPGSLNRVPASAGAKGWNATFAGLQVTLCMYRQSEKNLSNSNISSTCPHNVANISPLAAEIGSGVWGTPANFNGFRVLASLLQRRRLPDANQTFHLFGRLLCWYTIYTFSGALAPDGICHVQHSLCVQVLRSPILAALLHGTRVVGVSHANFLAWCKEWNY